MALPEQNSPTQISDRSTRRPILLRLLGTFGIIAALSAFLYFLTQSTWSDVTGDPANVRLAETIHPPADGNPPELSSPAPDFTVPTFDGQHFSLSGHLRDDGRPVFLNMWAAWCFPCRAEMPTIEAASRAHPGVHFIGIAVKDKQAPARSFIAEHGITYQIGFDIEAQVENAYFIWVMPTTYLIDSDGVIVDRIFGPIDEEQIEAIVSNLTSSGP